MGSKAFKPTLENTHKILELLDQPQRELKFIHVAGSNGKGSVCSILASALTEAGYTVGLFTSPHIIKFPERIRVNGACIDDTEVNTFIRQIKEQELDFKPSFFEITFGMALNHFKNQKCDICIIETGLGGRLDATNVISPLLSILTTISLEHTDMLGETIGEIAYEKAGIIKPNANVVVGKVDAESRNIFREKAKSVGVKLIESKTASNTDLESFFIADYQKENFRTAVTSLQEINKLGFTITEEHLKSGLTNLNKNSGYSGRLQIVGQNPLTIYDVSHNADGIKTTIKSVESIKNGELHIIYGTSADKNLKNIYPNLPLNAHYYFTEFTNPRSAKIDDLRNTFDRINLKSSSYYNTAQDAMNAAKTKSGESDTILVIGSFFLLSDFF